IDVVITRAEPLGIKVVVGDHERYGFESPTFGVLLQYPATDGAVLDYAPFVGRAHDAGALAVVAADLLALTLLRPPGELGAHVAAGLRRIAERLRLQTRLLARALESLGCAPRSRLVFDTLRVAPGRRTQAQVAEAARAKGINLRAFDNGDLGIALDETVAARD